VEKSKNGKTLRQGKKTGLHAWGPGVIEAYYIQVNLRKNEKEKEPIWSKV